MSDGGWELQQAVYAALVSAVDVPVLANAPQDEPVPYVDIGESDSLPADVQCRDGLEETITIHVWTKYGSQKQAKRIMSDIREALHLKDITVSGRSKAMAVVTTTRLFTDGDNEFLHGVITLRVNHFGPEEG
jgi:hypothetical protein